VARTTPPARAERLQELALVRTFGDE
jgi:hypothetical protein